MRRRLQNSLDLNADNSQNIRIDSLLVLVFKMTGYVVLSQHNEGFTRRGPRFRKVSGDVLGRFLNAPCMQILLCLLCMPHMYSYYINISARTVATTGPKLENKVCSDASKVFFGAFCGARAETSAPSVCHTMPLNTERDIIKINSRF